MGGDRVFAQEVFMYKSWGRIEKWGRECDLFVREGLVIKRCVKNKVHKVSHLLLNLLVLNAQFLRECFSVARKRAKFCNWS